MFAASFDEGFFKQVIGGYHETSQHVGVGSFRGIFLYQQFCFGGDVFGRGWDFGPAL
jgi:hypothetical protein